MVDIIMDLVPANGDARVCFYDKKEMGCFYDKKEMGMLECWLFWFSGCSIRTE
jgi:hypothetical protein